MTSEGGDRPCPSCGVSIVDDARFRTWCAACNWNLGEVAPAREPVGRVERYQRQLSRERSDALYRWVGERPERIEDRSTPWALLALATLVHLVGVAWIAAGVWLWFHRANAFGGAIALVAVFVGVSFLPRPSWRKPPITTYDRSELPATFALVDRVADALGSPRIHAIGLSSEVNAWITAGRPRRVLVLGLPLVRSLTPEELTAMLGHEMAHVVSGDPRRGWYIGGAIHTVHTWFQVLRMDRQVGQAGMDVGIGALADQVVRVLGWVVSWPVLWLMKGLQLMSWRGQQLAEYRCDRLAGRLAGPDAMARALGLLDLDASLSMAMQRAVLGDGSVTIWQAIEQQVADIPDRERERLRRLSTAPGRATDTTHPPTAYRTAILGTLPPGRSELPLDRAEHARVWAELQAHAGSVEETIYGRFGRSRPRPAHR